MSPEGSDGLFGSVGARKLGHLLTGCMEIGGIVAFGEGLQHPPEQLPGFGNPSLAASMRPARRHNSARRARQGGR
jgi:hypothetical protein